MAEPNVILTAFRLPVGLLKRIDRHAERLAKVTGLNITRTDAVRSLLNAALIAAEEKKPNGKKRP